MDTRARGDEERRLRVRAFVRSLAGQFRGPRAIVVAANNRSATWPDPGASARAFARGTVAFLFFRLRRLVRSFLSAGDTLPCTPEKRTLGGWERTRFPFVRARIVS